MTSIFLSCYNLPVIKQVAQVLGWVMNLLYKFFDMFGIQNIGLCILLFTIIIKMILLPMTIKQQKFTKLSSLMNPEIQAIQKKYQNKRDQDSMMKMNQELQVIYEKYGTSPTGGCLTMLIQMPILLALYGVISQIPTFIPEVGEYFENASEEIAESTEYFHDLDILDELVYKYENNKDEDDREEEGVTGLNKFIENYYDKEETVNKIEGAFTQIAASPEAVFSDYFAAESQSELIIDNLLSLSADKWDGVLEANKDDKELIEEYRKANLEDIRKSLSENLENVNAVKSEVDNAYDFIGVNLSQSPSSAGGVMAIIIPLLAAASQFLSVKLSNKFNAPAQQANTAENPMGSSMKVMTYTMPVMSAIFCYTLPSGLGVYWIMSAVVQSVQTVVIGKYFVKLDVDSIIKSNIEKQNKKRAKKGLPPKKITSMASANVKNIKVDTGKASDTEGTPAADTSKSTAGNSSKKGSISAKANLVSKYNDKKYIDKK